MDRRTFLQAAISTVSLVSTSICQAKGQTTLPVGTKPAASFVVFEDPSLPASRLFADTFQASGASVLSYQGDIASIWYDALPPLGASKRVLAGLTLGAEFFLLRTLASDASLKLLYDGYHERIVKNAMQHRMNGEMDLTRLEQSLNSVRQRWPVALANGLIESQAAPGKTIDLRIKHNTTGHETDIDTGISWMIELPGEIQRT